MEEGDIFIETQTMPSLTGPSMFSLHKRREMNILSWNLYWTSGHLTCRALTELYAASFLVPNIKIHFWLKIRSVDGMVVWTKTEAKNWIQFEASSQVCQVIQIFSSVSPNLLPPHNLFHF